MSVAQHESTAIDFPGLKGVFDVRYPKTTAGWLAPFLPFSGVMAEAVQTVAVTANIAAENLLAIGYKGHAGYSKRFGGVDISIDAILTDNVNVSGAYGYQLSDFEAALTGRLTLWTTNNTFGKKIIVSGLYTNSIMFDFKQNDNSSTTWTFAGDGVTYENYSVAASGVIGNIDYHCVNPLTWDEIHIFDGTNNVVLTGVQNATFQASLNRTDIFQIGQFTPYDRTVQHPYDVSVTMNTLSNEVNLVNWWDKFVPSYDPSAGGNCANGIVIKVRTQSIAGQSAARDFIIASGLRPTTSTLNTAVGANSTVALTWVGTDLRW